MHGRQKLPFGIKYAYGVGEMSEGIKNSAIATFLLFYYSQLLGLSPALAATAVGTSMVIDAFIDPVIGSVSDHWHGKLGRRHPFMYASALPAAASFLLLWDPPLDWSHEALFWYLVTVAVLVRSFITLYDDVASFGFLMLSATLGASSRVGQGFPLQRRVGRPTT